MHIKSASTDLCDALASIARRICSCIVESKGLVALVACQLISLNKRPGVIPINIGETARRILGKVIVVAIRNEIQMQ